MEQAASCHAVDVASLRARVRIAQLCPDSDAEHDLLRIANEQAQSLRKGQDAVSDLFIFNAISYEIELRDLKLVHLSEEAGRLISSAVHYLQSARYGSDHFGLEDPNSSRLIAYASVSPLDWDVLVNAFNSVGDKRSRQLSLSRIYVSKAAPHNTVSYMLALLVGEYSMTERDTTISTTVDPNLGFNGSSYRASNWTQAYSVPHLGYLYVDGQFVTRRELIRSFGSDDPDDLAEILGPRLKVSGPLRSDTLIFATATNRDLRLALRNLKPRRLERASS